MNQGAGSQARLGFCLGLTSQRVNVYLALQAGASAGWRIRQMGMNTVPIGIVLQLLACTCGAGGVNLQKYAQMPEVASCKLNVLGITGTVVGGLMEMVAQSFAPQSTLAPLGASALVINLLLAPKVNKDEVITRLDIAAVCIIGSGVVSVLIAAINSPPLPTFDGPELADFMSRTAAVVFVTLLAGVIVACIFGVCKVERTMKRGEIGVWGALYAVLSGTQASTTVLSSKVIGETLKVGAPGDVGWGFFIAAAAAVTISGISNMLIMNRGLGRGLQTLLAIPIFYGTAVCLNAIAGGMFWGEFEHFTSGQLVAVPFGVSCVIAGVVLLLIKAKRSSAKLEPSNGLATNVSISFRYEMIVWFVQRHAPQPVNFCITAGRLVYWLTAETAAGRCFAVPVQQPACQEPAYQKPRLRARRLRRAVRR